MNWWEVPLTDRALLLEKCIEFSLGIRSRQYKQARARAEAALFLYRGSRRIRLNGYESSYWGRDFEETPPHNNVIRSAVDWFTSIMVRNQVRPYFMTVKGNAKAREKADARQRVVDGEMTKIGLYGEVGALRARDAFIFRGGGIKYAADPRNARVVGSRVRSWEFGLPEREARLGFPRQMVHWQLVPREVLLGMVEPGSPEEKLIKNAQPERFDVKEQLREDWSEMLLVHELWHLPSVRPDFESPAAFGNDDDGEASDSVDPEHDGRHVMCLREGVIHAKPRPFSYFPVSFFRPFREPVGFWSQGIPEIIGGAHVALLEIADSKQRYIRRHAVPHLVAWRRAKLNLSALSNDDSRIWTTDQPPGSSLMYLHTDAMPSELLRYEDQIINWMKEELGVSNMNLFGEKPKGVDHQPGMEYLSEMTEIRQTAAYQAWEQTHIQDASIISDCYFELQRSNADLSVTFGDARDLVRLSASEFDISRNEFSITCQPSSAFATTPQAKFRQLKEYLQAGFFNGTPQAQTALRLMTSAPDIEAIVGDESGMEQNIERCLDAAAKGRPDEEWIPLPTMDLELAKTKARARFNRMEADGEDPAACDRVEKFFELCFKAQGNQMPTMGPTTQFAPLKAPGAPPMPGPGASPTQAPPGAPPGPPVA